jgi:hypothetical protein
LANETRGPSDPKDAEAARSFEKSLVSWGRYLFWAELRRRDYWNYWEQNGAQGNDSEFLGVLCYWAASMYVVIEGWEKAKFKDALIDALIPVRDYREALRRMRDAILNYQPDLISPKVKEFFQVPDTWLYLLHEEFCRWLRDHIDAAGLGASPEEIREYRDTMTRLIGWLPARLLEGEMTDAQRKWEQAEQMLDASGDTTSDKTLGLRDAVARLQAGTRETAKRVTEYRRQRIAEFGLNPDDYIEVRRWEN